MSGSAGIKIFAVLLVLIIRFVIKAAKSNSVSGNVSKATPPPFNGTSNPTPPQYNNPFQQTNTANTNPFPKTDTSNPNPFQASPPPFNNPFQDTPDAFSQPSQQNVNSNMGAGSTNYYCMYCGKKFQSVEALTRDTCFKHPKAGIGLQKHVLYRGPGRPNIGF